MPKKSRPPSALLTHIQHKHQQKRRRLADELKANEEKYRALFDTMLHGVVYQSMDGQIISANPAAERILGQSLAQMQGKKSIDPHWRAVREDGSDFPGESHPAMIALATGQAVHNVVMGVFNPAANDYRWININAVPQIREGESQPCQVYTTFEDITARTQAELALRQSEAEIRKINAELERRVKKRTRQLEETNKELESFAYSVSHDLRAPLRAIDGFSRILMAEHAEELSVESRDLLYKVRLASNNMGQLIEALLNLSRMSRTELRREDVDLSRFVNSILENLAGEHSKKDIQWIVVDQAPANGDPRLLRIVLENLLDNACKFASKREQAQIEFGIDAKRGDRTYFVRDNGVGFDPRYAGKLFGAFQRLHRADEFEGTGIGLATVQRIIHRHGGRIWAESELGQGATFYFTLGE